MKILPTIPEMQEITNRIRLSGKKIGFVPTMGYLHEGHLSLVREAQAQCDFVVVSIFVNPTQFGRNEDLNKYPRDMKRDTATLEELGVDVLFTPDRDAMYPSGYLTYVVTNEITQYGEGAMRPTHFRGVTTIVTKLLNIVQPNLLFLGQKDIQQAVVLRRMVLDLNMNTEVEICPTVRENDGLAMSSRNVYLNEAQRIDSIALHAALNIAEKEIQSGVKDCALIEEKMRNLFSSYQQAELDYILFADCETFLPVKLIECKTIIATAARFGKTRLLDNIIIEPSLHGGTV